MRDIKQVIVVRRDLNMRKGKIAAQVAHAAMKFLIENDEAGAPRELKVKLSPEEAEWIETGFTKVVVGCNSEEELNNLIFKAQLAGVEVQPIIDAGRTEFHGVSTLTCAAFGPCDASDVDPITGNLKLM